MKTDGISLDKYRRNHPALGRSPDGTMYGYFTVGRLHVIAAPSPETQSDVGWPWEHVSVSRFDSREPPTWEEMDRVRHLF